MQCSTSGPAGKLLIAKKSSIAHCVYGRCTVWPEVTAVVMRQLSTCCSCGWLELLVRLHTGNVAAQPLYAAMMHCLIKV
jgi:hypothetical protein